MMVDELVGWRIDWFRRSDVSFFDDHWKS